MATKALSGGEKLKARLASMNRRLGRGAELKVGFLSGATYPDGTPVAAVAAYQEFGTPNARFPIPPRPFFRTMIREKSPGWPDTLATLLKTTDYDAKRALDILGEEIAGELRESIIDTNEPPLSPVTLMLRRMKVDDPGLTVTLRTVYEAIRRVKKGEASGVSGTGAKPLVASGHLLASVDKEIIEK